jgi:hypothetical protein
LGYDFDYLLVLAQKTTFETLAIMFQSFFAVSWNRTSSYIIFIRFFDYVSYIPKYHGPHCKATFETLT